ncbi:MAG: radical SAM protein [Candidatus Hodarchaeales archaeon]|jgi:radical SAM superfamily enzyme YgiQ (UPF0313 family)
MRVRYSSGWKGSLRSFTASFESHEHDLLTIDLAGRWIVVIFDKITYRRGLDGKWMSISRQTLQRKRIRNVLTLNEIKLLYKKIFEAVTRLKVVVQVDKYIIDVEKNDPYKQADYPKLASKWTNLMGYFSYERDLEEKSHFNKIYSKVGILPPDRYGSLVLQVTEGCIYNKCNFCTFYRGVKYHQKSPKEFQDHIKIVKKFIAKSLGRFHSIFLGDANALSVPQKDLLKIFDIINNEFNLISKKQTPSLIFKKNEEFSGIYSFLDVFTGINKTVEEFHNLAQKDLRMVYLGVESGSPNLLKYLNKPNKIEKIIDLAQNLHEAGINIAALILIGPGGKKHAIEHVWETTKLLKELNLSAKDMIFLSKLVIPQNTPEEKISQLNDMEMEKQMKEIKTNLLQTYENRRLAPKIARYEIRDFLY